MADQRTALRALLIVAALCCLPPRYAAALEVTAGDYEALPPGTSLALLYYQHAERNSLVTGGRQVSSNFRLDSDIALARYIHVLKLSDDAVLDPQVIVPFGRLRTGAMRPCWAAPAAAPTSSSARP
jgi:hypothetical protein